MASDRTALLHLLHRLASRQSAAGSPDALLLDRFVRSRDEQAFAALVERHGPMVLRLCRRVLADLQAAEDAFQATFLVLARRASAIRRPEHLAGWLHGVAYRIARKARTIQVRRLGREELSADVDRFDPHPDPLAEVTARDLLCVVDEEVRRLPEVFRLPVILCCLEGHTQEEAARRLGWTASSVKGRLERGRARLRARLTRRGLSLPAALAAVGIGQGATSAGVSTALAGATVRAAVAFACVDGVRAGTISARAVTLAEGVLQGTAAVKLKEGAAVALLVGAILGGVGLRIQPARTSTTLAQQVEVRKEAGPDSDPAAKRLVRLDAYGDPLPTGAIARLGSLRLHDGLWVRRVALSPDGCWVISESAPPYRLWDARTGKEKALPADLTKLTFCTTPNRLLGLKQEGGRAVLWDIVAEKEIARLSLELGPNDRVAVSADGTSLVMWSRREGPDGVVCKITFADVATGAVRKTIDVPDKPLWDFVVAAASDRFAANYEGGSIDVWDWKTHTIVMSTTLKGDGYRGVSLSPDGGTLAGVLYAEKRVHLWDVRTKQELAPLITEPGRGGIAVSFSPDGTALAVAYETEVGIWDLAARREVRRLRGTAGSLGCLAFSRDGKRLAAGDWSNIRLWDPATGQPCHDFGHIWCVDSVAFAPDGRTVATCAGYSDRVIRTWDPFTGQVKGRWRGHTGGVQVIAYSPDGKVLASCSQDRTVRLWDTATGQEADCLEAKDGKVIALAFSPDGKLLVSAGESKAVHCWDVATHKHVRTIDNGEGPISQLSFSPNGRLLATLSVREGGVTRLWDLASGAEVRQFRGYGHFSFASDSQRLALSCGDSTVRVVDVAAGRQIRVLGEPRQVDPSNYCYGVAFAPDDRSLAAAYEDGTIRLWEVESSRERVRFSGHSRDAGALAYSPDGALLVSGGGDFTGLVWDIFGRYTVARKQGNFSVWPATK